MRAVTWRRESAGHDGDPRLRKGDPARHRDAVGGGGESDEGDGRRCEGRGAGTEHAPSHVEARRICYGWITN